MKSARLLNGLRLSLSLLTIFPARASEADRATGKLAIIVAPLTGLALWLPVALVTLLVRAWLSYDFGDLLPAMTAIAVLALLTRGLHLDGLADVGDALASYRSPADAREIMRRGDVGPLGVATMVFVVLIQAAALEIAISSHHGTVTLLVAIVTGRLIMTVSCVEGTKVAPGSTMGALVVGTVSRWTAVICCLAVVAGCALAAQLDYHTLDRRTETLQAISAPLVALALTWPLRRHLVRRLGGINGDTLGAQCEIASLIAIFVMAGNL